MLYELVIWEEEDWKEAGYLGDKTLGLVAGLDVGRGSGNGGQGKDDGGEELHFDWFWVVTFRSLFKVKYIGECL